VLAFQDQLLQRVRALPSVTDVGATSTLPLVNTGYSSDFTVAGRAPGEYGTEVLHRDVTPDYFRTMRVPLLKGRVFTSADRTDAPPVVVINEALAQRYFRGQDPVGQRITFAKAPDSTSVWETIVGVVGSEHQTTLALSPQIEAYAPFSQETQNGMTLVVRTTTDPAAIGPAIRGVVAALDPALPIVSMQPMSVVTATSLARQRFLTTLVLVFAGVGLVLAVIGVYAVMTQLAKRRTREMGIRIALGAQASDVRWLIVRHGVALTIVGLVGGIVAALYATRGLMTLLYEVRPADPLTYVAVPALLIATALIASWVPARQASRADPATTLRAE
jgi:predicted permease